MQDWKLKKLRGSRDDATQVGRTIEFELSTLKLFNFIFSTNKDFLRSINVLYECEN